MRNDFQVTEFFNLKEFVCPCCGVTAMDDGFLKRLNALRVQRGRVMVSTGGGYRCPAYQRSIHIARSEILKRPAFEPVLAAHTLGRAADITLFGLETDDKIPISSSDIPTLKDLGFTGIGISPAGWVHLDDVHETFQTWGYSY